MKEHYRKACSVYHRCGCGAIAMGTDHCECGYERDEHAPQEAPPEHQCYSHPCPICSGETRTPAPEPPR